MAFTLGNHSIDEILYGIASHDGRIQYVMDQLSSASIEISSESTEITDKRGNSVRTIYKTKNGTFTATNAFLHPQIMNAASGAKIQDASDTSAYPTGITMPKIEILAAGATSFKLNMDPATGEKLGTVDDASVQVIGLYGSGANTAPLTKGSVAEAGKYVYDMENDAITVPAAGDGLPVKYLVKYDRQDTAGLKMTNSANEFPETVELLLFASYVDPCDDDLKPVYILLPSFQPSPETTISLNSDEQEMDYTGALQLDYCSADQALYYIFYPAESKVITGVVGK